MALMQRKTTTTTIQQRPKNDAAEVAPSPKVLIEDDDVSKEKNKGICSSSISSRLTITFTATIILFVTLLGIHQNANESIHFNNNYVRNSGSLSNNLDWVDYPSEGVKVAITWNGGMTTTSTMNNIAYIQNRGPHRINIMTTHPNAIPYVSISGDVLQSVPLSENEHRSWSGEFVLPMSGIYSLKMICPRCNNKEGDDVIDFKLQSFKLKIDDSIVSSSELHEVQHLPLWKELTKEMISKGAWIASSKLKLASTGSGSEQQHLPEYVWMNPNLIDKEVNSIDSTDAFVVKEGSVTSEHGFYDFQKLSNYELVCFFGSKSAKNIHGSLLSLRPNLFPHQRPFKFHYYEVNNMINPDRTWDEETKKKFRKCKHILVSIDEPDIPLSQKDYTTQMTALLTHLTKAFDDETFPIWVFTSMESPIDSKNCFDPVGGLRSSEHPCNVAVKKLFADSPFNKRVRLLDNTDMSNMSLPNTDSLFTSQQKHLLGAIALRVFIIVGYQVKIWRDNNQVGHINGLTRGDIEHPNFELIPYDFSKIM